MTITVAAIILEVVQLHKVILQTIKELTGQTPVRIIHIADQVIAIVGAGVLHLIVVVTATGVVAPDLAAITVAQEAVVLRGVLAPVGHLVVHDQDQALVAVVHNQPDHEAAAKKATKISPNSKKGSTQNSLKS